MHKNLSAIEKGILDRLKTGLLKQKIAWTTFYAVRSENIGTQSSIPATIQISGDSDFISEKMFMVIDGIFKDANDTILMNLVDAGSGRQITRIPIDLRAIANPGIFDPNTANVGVSQYTTGIDFKFLFRKNSNLQFTFENTDDTNTHRISVVLQGKAIENWDKIPHDLG